MNTDEIILKEMLDRATNPTKDTADELCLQMFCRMVSSDAQLIDKALELLLAKIHAPDITESVRAIALLEECMTKCGADFQNEVAKFRFLNNLILMVSSKHDGAKTPAPIKKRITECLLLWTTDYPQKTKIREVYDMLSKQEGSGGNVVEQGAASAEVKRESTLGIDEQLLAELLHSGDPENLKRANLLIQHRVNQESRRNELHLQQKSELQEVENIVQLLNQMLDAYEIEGRETNDDTKNLIRELYLSSKKHKPLLQRLPELIENSDQELIAETMDANNMLQAVLKRYKEVMVHPTSTKLTANGKESGSSNTDLLTQILSDLPSDLSSCCLTEDSNSSLSTASKCDPLDELSQIFGKTAAKADNIELLGSFDLLSDVSIMTATADTLPQAPAGDQTVEKRGFRELREIDKLSEELFKQSLPTVDRISSFKKEPEKVTLNDLAKEKLRIKPATSGFNIPKKPSEENNTVHSVCAKQHPLEEQDDVMILFTEEPKADNCDTCTETKDTTNSVQNTQQPRKELPIKNLADIEVSLDDVSSTSEERMLLDDDDVKITLNFTENHPSKHVSVLVITVLNKSAMAIHDFQFEASVKRPSKVRLLQPTAFSMQPFKRFRPPAPINQVMLLLNPTGQPIDVTCIMGYKCGEDPDPIKESIVVKHIPYVE